MLQNTTEKEMKTKKTRLFAYRLFVLSPVADVQKVETESAKSSREFGGASQSQ